MSDNHDQRSDAAEAMMKKIDDDRAQKDRDQRLTAAKAKSDAAEAMMKKIEEDRVRKEEEQEEEKKQIEQNNHRIEIERKAKVKKEQDAEEEQRRQLIIEEARSVSRKFSGSLYKTRTVHLSERSTLTDPSQASSSSKYVASGPGSTISPNVDAKESVRISAIQNQHSSFSTASKNNASEPTVRMSDVFGKLVMMKIKAKQAKIRTKNHSSKKVAHKLGVRLDRRSGVMLSETAARDLIHAVKLLAASPVNQEWLSTSNAHDGILINNSSTAEALIFTLKDYDYNTNTAQTIVQSIKRVPQELRQEIQKFLNEDELFQLLICFANFDFNKNGVLDFEEFRALFSSLISATGVQHFFVTMDLDNDGTIAFGEFLALVLLRNGTKHGGRMRSSRPRHEKHQHFVELALSSNGCSSIEPTRIARQKDSNDQVGRFWERRPGRLLFLVLLSLRGGTKHANALFRFLHAPHLVRCHLPSPASQSPASQSVPCVTH